MKQVFTLAFLLFSLVSFANNSDSLYVTTSDSVQLFVKVSGKGTPVLFIHGGPGSNSAYFEREGGNVFEQDVQMIYLDQRGCGRSGNAANKDYSLQRMINDFETVREALGIEQWIIMPHSFGGILANEYALQYPGRIKAMVLLNCTLNIHASAKSGIAKTIEILDADLNEQEKNYMQNDSLPLLDRWFNAFWQLSRFDKKHAVMFDKKENAVLDSILTNSVSRSYEFGQQVWQYPAYFVDHTTNTPLINTPVLVISGTRDYTIGVDQPRLFKYPQMEIKYVEGGHALYLEQNEALYNAVAPFLRQASH